jgi:hypothetical protein
MLEDGFAGWDDSEFPDSVVTGNGRTATGLQKRQVLFLSSSVPSTQCSALHSTSSFLLCYDLVIPSNGAVVDRLVSFCLLFMSVVVFEGRQIV